MALMERDEKRELWLPVAGFREMKIYLMQTRSSPTALSPPLLPHYLDPGVHVFQRVPQSPGTLRARYKCVSQSLVLRAVGADTQGGFAIHLIPRSQGWAPPSLQQGWLEPPGPPDTAEPMC